VSTAPHEALTRFAEGYPFGLDEFQARGVTALAEGRSALVAAPTGAGKTVVGEFAVWQALDQGGKCFYTTPIKALSNQKYADLVRRHGAARVGLLTGDNAVNGDAPIVVMTTEVLRNMLYEASRTLVGLQAVVLDEVHYLADRERGAVWEEVIVQLPPSVQLACLSATVSNAEDFGAWLRSVRETCDVVISEHRPVPLEHHYAVGDRIYPTFSRGAAKAGKKSSKRDADAARQARGGVPNPEVLMLERRAGTSNRVGRGGRRYSGPRLRPPRRSDVVAELGRRHWLPAIYFLFSRSGCDDAVGQLVEAGTRLVTPEEQAAIRAVVDERTADLPADDLEVLGYGRWARALEVGVAAHHAGMVPVFKEAVEELFVRGLVKVCFATETLALGINMPARTVVVERLEKWNGSRHELLSPGQFTQLTGRAGRRGLDPIGHAVVLYQRDVDFPTVAGLVGRRISPLHSSFAPSYNMAVNLLRRHDRVEAEDLLARSFAQFEADATVAGDEARITRNREALDGYAARVTSAHGDAWAYWGLRRELSRLESDGARRRRERVRSTGGTDVAAVTAGGAGADGAAVPAGDDGVAERVAALRADLRAHPVHHDPELHEIEVWAHRHDDLATSTERLERQVRHRTGSIVRQFDRIVGVLADLDYLADDDRGQPRPTAHGRRLARLYAETDLVLAECLRRGVLDGLDAPALAAAASIFVHETRLNDPPPPRLPTAPVRAAVAAVHERWQDVAGREEAAGVPVTRVPDAGFAEVAWRWASEQELEDTLAGTELTAGDFVRSTKQVADLLRQIRDATRGDAEHPGLSDTAHAAACTLVRGVVAHSGM